MWRLKYSNFLLGVCILALIFIALLVGLHFHPLSHQDTEHPALTGDKQAQRIRVRPYEGIINVDNAYKHGHAQRTLLLASEDPTLKPEPAEQIDPAVFSKHDDAVAHQQPPVDQKDAVQDSAEVVGGADLSQEHINKVLAVEAKPAPAAVVSHEEPAAPAVGLFENNSPPVVDPPQVPDAPVPPPPTPLPTAAPTVKAIQTVVVQASATGHAFSSLYGLYIPELNKRILAANASGQGVHSKDVISRLHRVLRTGSLVKTSTTPFDTPQAVQQLRDLRSRVGGMLVMEYTAARPCTSVSSFLSKTLPHLAHIVHQFPSPSSILSVPCKSVDGRNVITVDGPQALTALPETDGQQMACLQYFDDLSLFDTDMLPFEFESLIGKLLSRCRASLFPKTLPGSPFFTAWESVNSLLESAYQTQSKQENHTISSVYGFVQFENVPARGEANITMSWAELTRLPMDQTSRHKLASMLMTYSLSNVTAVGDLQSVVWVGSEVKHLDAQPPRAVVNSPPSTASASPAVTIVAPAVTIVAPPTTIVAPAVQQPNIVPTVAPTVSPFVNNFLAMAFPQPVVPAVGTNDAAAEPSDGRRRLSSWSSSSSTSSIGDALGADPVTAVTVSKQTVIIDEADERIFAAYKKAFTGTPHPTVKADQYTMSTATRSAQQKMYAQEKGLYKAWLAALAAKDGDAITPMQSILKSQLVYVIGGRISLLSMKIAKQLAKQPIVGLSMPLVASVLLDNTMKSTHFKLSKVMGVANNLITSPERSALSIGALVAAPETAQTAIIQADLMVHLLGALYSSDSAQCDDSLLTQAMAAHVHLSAVTFIQLPERSVLLEVVSLLAPQCLQQISSLYSDPMVFLQSVAKETQLSITIHRLDQSYLPNLFRLSIADAAGPTKSTGLSMYTASVFDVIPEQKKILLSLLINLPVWSYQIDLQSLTAKEVRLVIKHNAQWTVEIEHGAETIQHTVVDDQLLQEYILDKQIWSAVRAEFQSHPAELADGKFSFVDHDSSMGLFSSLLSTAFSNATVLSLERSDAKTAVHAAVVEELGLTNNAICIKTSNDEDTFKNFHDSPELFRFQLLYRGLFKNFVNAERLSTWGDGLSSILSTALTSFVYVPNKSLVSWAMFLLYGEVYLQDTLLSGLGVPLLSERMIGSEGVDGNIKGIVSLLQRLQALQGHPQRAYQNFETQFLFSAARTNEDGSTALLVSPLVPQPGEHSSFPLPMVRCDIVNMTRHVKHHFQSDLDGHKRTYTMHIGLNMSETGRVYLAIGDPSSASFGHNDQAIALSRTSSIPVTNNSAALVLPLGHHANQHSVVFVHLHRDRDNFPIPYTSIYGITLISALRLGLHEKQRDRLFKSFLSLPLYEDMAPWNLVLMGQSLEYIDYDTREFTFDMDVPKAYQIMSVLMNYKRTVQDFRRCGSSSSTVYGLPFISDCVGSTSGVHCSDLRYAVPCGDGKCHSDYISCLRSLSRMADEVSNPPEASLPVRSSRYNSQPSEDVYDAQFVRSLAQAMNSVVSSFNHTDNTVIPYADFLKALGKAGKSH